MDLVAPGALTNWPGLAGTQLEPSLGLKYPDGHCVHSTLPPFIVCVPAGQCLQEVAPRVGRIWLTEQGAQLLASIVVREARWGVMKKPGRLPASPAPLARGADRCFPPECAVGAGLARRREVAV